MPAPVVFTCECTEATGAACPRRIYLVTSHEGTVARVAYCGPCAELAGVDWNGETKRIDLDPDQETRDGP